MAENKLITVLQLCEHFGGREASIHGVARSFQWWLPAFDKSRFRVLLCSRKGRDKAAEVMEQSGLNPLYLGYGKYDPRNLIKLLRIINEEKVDIIHAHGYGACTWGRIAGLLKNVPVIVHERCNTRETPFFQRPVEWFLGKFTKYALAVSVSSRDFCIKKRFMKPDAVQVLYNGIMMKDVPPPDPEFERKFRNQNGAGESIFLLGIVGRLESHKGHIDAFKALEIVSKKHKNVMLWVIGDGSFEDDLKNWVRDHHLEEAVKFFGFRSDVRKIIRCFDAQLFPSHMEGTPNTLYEAMAVGNAIIASTADGQGEILEDGKTALMFEPGDYKKMAEHIVCLIENNELAARLGNNALKRSVDFDGSKTIEAMQNLYLRIMEEKKL